VYFVTFTFVSNFQSKLFQSQKVSVNVGKCLSQKFSDLTIPCRSMWKWYYGTWILRATPAFQRLFLSWGYAANESAIQADNEIVANVGDSLACLCNWAAQIHFKTWFSSWLITHSVKLMKSWQSESKRNCEHSSFRSIFRFRDHQACPDRKAKSNWLGMEGQQSSFRQ
jgi:hypothetical protein